MTLLILLALLVLVCADASAQSPAIVEVRVEQEGQAVVDPVILTLVETTVGEPLSMRDVRESIAHLTSLNRYDDVQVLQEPLQTGVRLRYVLFPLHPVDRIEFRGLNGVSATDLRRVITERFGLAPAASRARDIEELVAAAYRIRGYPDARVVARVEETHRPDRASMIVDVQSGPRTAIASISIDHFDPREQTTLLGLPDIRVGHPYDSEAIERELQRYAASMRSRGYYEARATHQVEFTPAGAEVNLRVRRGPLVVVAFAGDPVPESERERLVPVRLEGSADEDLLEDASRAVEGYFRSRGYRDAVAPFRRDESVPGQLTITFTVSRGPRYVTADVSVTGNTAITADEIRDVVRLREGQPFVRGTLDAAVGALQGIYRSRGFTRAQLQPRDAVLPADTPSAETRQVTVTIAIVEGPRTTIRAVDFNGNAALSRGELSAIAGLVPGDPYSQGTIAAARERLELEYRNRGYDTISVEPATTLAAADTEADIRFTVSEGRQVLVDHIIILGNQRTNTAIIERELLLRPGEPLGYTARIDSQQRLSALGLFRRVRIDELPHGTDPRRDVLVQVEEAPPTTVGYGGGLEIVPRLREGEAGEAVERYEFVPRGFFEVGRRNMWGKNRAVNLFSRVSLRSRDAAAEPSEPSAGGYAFRDYRVYATYREPRVFGLAADLLVTGILDQAVRSSFNFRTREVRAEAGLRLSSQYSVAGRYSFEHTELFDVNFTEEEQPVIDRHFSQVRLSKFSTSLIRDSRDDRVDPSTGRLLIVDGELAARAFGSEVGFIKSYLQAFSFLRLPAERRVVVALGARLGAAHGFKRSINGEVVQDLPASERFFAGGDTTVRGFSLDRLGTEGTISASGFPTGGNGVVILNGELRVEVAGAIQAVAFMDGGNVFLRPSDIALSDMRASAGFGLRYRSPVGPIRVDVGFKLQRRELVPGRLERPNVLHISLGQAF